jgi:hypothetical protein
MEVLIPYLIFPTSLGVALGWSLIYGRFLDWKHRNSVNFD